jgi:hypothetical protein
MAAIEDFVAALSRTQTPPNLFNPFNQICLVHDRPDAPAIRCRNLIRLLRAHQRLGTKMVWVFEAPSYQGIYEDIGELLGMQAVFEKATEGESKTALTTRLAWKLAQDLNLKPLIWEAIPFHPHYANQPLTNRRPTSKEIGQYKHFLLEPLGLFAPEHVLAVGRVAERALEICGVEATYVRHPAQGGAVEFREQVAGVLAA